MNHAISDALRAIERRDWDRLRPMLHPYLHWTDPGGRVTRGRTTVLRRLADERPRTEPPASFELRDGQIYRWVEREVHQ
ncbi:MAG: nuclear transport factor 2 family protein [Acidimicrobiales bacterium]|nr:nuclear transport factor 2 family protein [Acidimicrobiales bacterium]